VSATGIDNRMVFAERRMEKTGIDKQNGKEGERN
jgi:hypothetical protein